MDPTTLSYLSPIAQQRYTQVQANSVAPPPPPLPPSDARYLSEQNALTRTYNDSNLGIQNRETGIRSEYGFDPEYANNPYTRANLLQRAADQRYRTSTNSYAGRGQLYSGALDRQRASDTFATGAAQDTAQRSYTQELAQIAQDRLNAQRTFDTGKDTSYVDLLDRLTASQPDPSLYSPPDSGGGGTTASATAIAKAQNILKNQQGKSPAAISWAKQILGR